MFFLARAARLFPPIGRTGYTNKNEHAVYYHTICQQPKSTVFQCTLRLQYGYNFRKYTAYAIIDKVCNIV